MIYPIIAFATAAVCLLLLVVLFARVRAVEAYRKLDKHRSKDAGLADLLGYAALVEDGTVVLKNGALLASFLYTGPDNASSTDDDRDYLAARVNQALAPLGAGWMLHIDGVRRPSFQYSDPAASHFPDPVCEAIDAERRRHFQSLGTLYEGYFVVTLTYMAPVLAERQFTELMFEDDRKSPTRAARTQQLLEYFNRELLNIQNRLSVGKLQLERLRGREVIEEDGRKTTHDDLLAWLHLCVTGKVHPIQLPDNPIYLDSLIGGEEMFGGTVPRIGRNYVQVVAIDGFPLQSSSGLLSALAELPCQYRWSTRFIFMEQHEALALLEKYRKKWRQRILGFFDQIFRTNTGSINQDAVSMAADAEAAISETSGGIVSQGYYTSVFVLMHPERDALDVAARLIEKAVNRLGFSARVETINTIEAYLGSLPGHGYENVRRPLVSTFNLAHLMPTSTIWTGSEVAPCPFYPANSPPLMHCTTHGSTPFRLNLHDRDLGHTILFGPPGSGKSTHLALMAAQLRRYRGMTIFAFDKGMSLYPLTKAVGGRHFSVASDDDALAFCPLQFLDGRTDRAWAMDWLETVARLNGVNPTPEQLSRIASAVVSMHGTGSRTLTDFTVTVQDRGIREALQNYTIESPMGHLLDAQEDGLTLSHFTTFEIEALMNLDPKYALPVLLYLFRRIEMSLKGQPAAIIIDEAWLMLGHDVFRAKIREWLKTLRKANCVVILATQSLSDAARSGILDVLVEATSTKIFLANPAARDEDASALYARMGLNARQIQIISGAIPKREYYYTSQRGRRLYDLSIGRFALSFVGVSDKESIAQIKALEAKYGNYWVDEWLRMRGLNSAKFLPPHSKEAA